MTARDWMIEKQESLGLSREQMAERCNPRDKQTNRLLCMGQVSEKLIEMLEEDDTSVTGVKIAKRICKAYGIRNEEHKLSLIPLNHRPGPDYDPTKFSDMVDYRFFTVSEESAWKIGKTKKNGSLSL